MHEHTPSGSPPTIRELAKLGVFFKRISESPSDKGKLGAANGK